MVNKKKAVLLITTVEEQYFSKITNVNLLKSFELVNYLNLLLFVVYQKNRYKN